MSYGWPVAPFDQQHPVRAFFCDPRIGDKGSKAFHFGIDVSGPDGTPVYAVEPGIVHLEGAQNVAVVEAGGTRTHGYWHVVPAVRNGQRVGLHSVLGHIAKGWGHVHFAERKDGTYRNPLRIGALTPFADHGAPSVDRIVAERNGDHLDLSTLGGVVELIAEAHDVPPISAPPPWQGLPVTPALVRWRLVRDAREVVPWRVVADFRSTLPAADRFTTVYAPGTRQNDPDNPGLYRFLLAAGFDTRRHPDGPYRLDVEAADIRGNTTRRHAPIVLANGSL
jgi:murein DD-endopeptidase MepM/ murein hydrolase activator NlpD